jgi:hypothetical protein
MNAEARSATAATPNRLVQNAADPTDTFAELTGAVSSTSDLASAAVDRRAHPSGSIAIRSY